MLGGRQRQRLPPRARRACRLLARSAPPDPRAGAGGGGGRGGVYSAVISTPLSPGAAPGAGPGAVAPPRCMGQLSPVRLGSARSDPARLGNAAPAAARSIPCLPPPRRPIRAGGASAPRPSPAMSAGAEGAPLAVRRGRAYPHRTGQFPGSGPRGSAGAAPAAPRQPALAASRRNRNPPLNSLMHRLQLPSARHHPQMCQAALVQLRSSSPSTAVGSPASFVVDTKRGSLCISRDPHWSMKSFFQT